MTSNVTDPVSGRICLSVCRLLDFRTQENYYSKLVQRYEDFWAGSGKSLNDALASLSLDGATLDGYSHVKSSASNGPNSESKELSTILMAMRKIREAIVSSARKDTFAMQAYVFIIRATILAKHMESYHPALLHLLHTIHPVTPLATVEYNEFVGYYILDLACRQKDLAAAYHVKSRSKYKDGQVEAVVKALVHGDWCTFWNKETLVTSHQKRLMEWAQDEMRSRALGCLCKGYLSVDKNYLEKAIHWRWEQLVEENNIGWQLEGDVVIIRRIRGK